MKTKKPARNSSQKGQAFWDGLKNLFRACLKLLSILLSWSFKLIAITGEKLSEMFEKLGTK